MHIYKSVYVQSTLNGSKEFLESYACVKHKVNISSITYSRIIKYREIAVLPSYCILTCDRQGRHRHTVFLGDGSQQVTGQGDS